MFPFGNDIFLLLRIEGGVEKAFAGMNSHFYLYESDKNGQPLDQQMLQAEPTVQLKISHTHPKGASYLLGSALSKRYIK